MANGDRDQLAPEIVLGARQFPNPEGIAPRMDTEGAPPTQFTSGAKLSLASTRQPRTAPLQVAPESPKPLKVAPEEVTPPPVLPEDAPPSAMQPSEQQMPRLFPEHTNTAEHRMQEIPAPVSGAEGQTAHAAKMRIFGDAEEKLESQLLRSPDEFADPLEYTKHLEAIRAGRGALREAKAEYELTHPWGSMESAHPGFFGKLGHAFGTIGSVAAPAIAEEVPGSRPNLQAQRALGAEEVKAATGGEAAAVGGELKEAQSELAGEKTQTEETKQALQKAQAEKAAAQTEAMEPAAKNQAIHDLMSGNPEGGPRINQLTGKPYTYAVAYGAVMGMGKPAAQTKLQHVSGTLNGKPTMANFDPAKGEYTNPDTHEVIHGFQPAPTATTAGPVVITPSGKVERAVPGATLEPGTQTPSGFAELGRPTVQQRTAAGRAEAAVTMIPEVTARIDRMRDQLGPISGRWNEFMQGKVGMDNPEFAALRADLLMLGSAVALAHAQGRLPENLREEFDRAINQPKQTPENLKATLNAILPWMQKMQQLGASPIQPGGAAPAAPTAPGGRPSFSDWQKAQKRGATP